MDKFEIIALTAPGHPSPSVAIAAGRAGELGVLDLEHTRCIHTAREHLKLLAHHAGRPFGAKLPGDAVNFIRDLMHDAPEGLQHVILANASPEALKAAIAILKKKGLRVLLESTCIEQAETGAQLGVDGVIAKGNEAGGRVGHEAAFILLQRFLQTLSVPVWAQGGIGLHTAAACFTAGAAGVVLDAQLALTRESPLPSPIKARIATFDGTETLCVGESAQETYRLSSRFGSQVLKALQSEELDLLRRQAGEKDRERLWRRALQEQAGWDSMETSLLLFGQDIALAASLANRFVTVGGVLRALRENLKTFLASATSLCAIAEGSPLAQSHGTAYPITQGPMARISDTPAFTLSVAQAGALPFVAAAMMPPPELAQLLAETRTRLADRPWGVGLLGFLKPDFYKQQLAAVLENRPPFALIAGGSVKQVQDLEDEGIATYVHVPTPGLLRMFLRSGLRRFIFEGRECGGHIGPLTSFVLWQSALDVIEETLGGTTGARDLHVLFAGGIHDARSAAMVAALAAPLVRTDIKAGLQMGTAYLFTEEAISTGAIAPPYLEAAIGCKKTTILESGAGHTSRCIPTPHTRVFRERKTALMQAGVPADELRHELEKLNLGRLLIGAKGMREVHDGTGHFTLEELSEAVQRDEAMYMLGELAALRDRSVSMASLHADIAVRGTQRLADLEAKHSRGLTRTAAPPVDIAVVGMACVFPQANDLQDYWKNILRRVNTVREVPGERWNPTDYFRSERDDRDTVYSKWGAFLGDIPFDPLVYGMPPNSLPSIEPLQLLTLEVVRAAIADAGYATRPFERERTSVIIGISGVGDLAQMYSFRAALPMFFGHPSREVFSHFDGVLPDWTEDSFPGILGNVTAGRVANRFDLGGINCTIDAACASSLAAVYMGIKELETGTSDIAIVGGADCMQNAFTFLCFSNTQALSPRGRCCAMDEEADGIVLGEGIVIAILKRLKDAERDGDRIYSVIKAAAASSDGRDRSMTAPRHEGQTRALRRAYERAGVSPATVELVEAHATGTVVGDRVEIGALTEVFKESGAGPRNCAVGSVKSMIGHTKSASGLAGILKVSMALHHKVLPPTLGVEKPNEALRAADCPLYPNTFARPWIHASSEVPRSAGVSSFGFGGTNLHVVLQEYTRDYLTHVPKSCFQDWPSELLIWQGTSRRQILEKIAPVEAALSRGTEPNLRDLAFTLANDDHRPSQGETPDRRLRLAVVATSAKDLQEKLARARTALTDTVAHVQDPSGIFFSEQPMGREHKTAFLFPGQGSQYVHMLSDLAIHFPQVRRLFEQSDAILAAELERPLSRFIFPPPVFTEAEALSLEKALARPDLAQAAIGTASLGIYRLLERLGYRPDMIGGHSYGETVALCIAGVYDEAALIRISHAQGRFIAEAAGDEPGTMAAVQSGRDLVEKLLDGLEGIWIANLNAPQQTVVSGTQTAVEAAIARCRERNIRARLIPVACALHSPIVAGSCDMLKKYLSIIPFNAPEIEVFSNLSAQPYPKDPQKVAEQFIPHMGGQVRFVDQIEAMYAAGARVFVEVGPGKVATALVSHILGDRPHVAISSDQPDRPGLLQFQHMLGHLAAQGLPATLDLLFEGRSPRLLEMGNLDAAGTRAPLTPTTWMVNGGGARPLSDPPRQGVTQHFALHPAPPADAPTARAPAPETHHPPATDHQPPAPDATSPPGTPPGIVQPPTLRDGSQEAVMLQFQQLMDRFLDTQQHVLVDYFQEPLATGPGGHPIPAGTPGGTGGQPPAAGMSPPGDLPAPGPPATPAPDPQTSPTIPAASPSPSHAPGRPAPNTAATHLLEIISDRTGYPQHMLGLDVDLEADLGIDSIKRVEILSTLTARLDGSSQGENSGDGLEALGAIKTLRGIIEFLEGSERFNNSTPGAKTLAEDAPTPHPPPLLPASHSRVLRGQGTLQIERRLDLDLDCYLTDHRLDGKPVLPAAMALELMAEAVQLGWPAWTISEVLDTRLFKGILLEGRSLDIQILATSRENGAGGGEPFNVVVEIRSSANMAQAAYRCTVVLSRQPVAPSPTTVPAIAGLQPFPLPSGTAYEQWLFHGPRFQCIQEIEGISDQGMCASMRPSSPQGCLGDAGANPWFIDPVILDSGPQLTILWARATHDITCLPSRFQAVRRFHPFGEGPLRCTFQVLQSPAAQPSLRANVFYTDAEGRLAMMVEGLESIGSKSLNRLAGLKPPGGTDSP